MQYKTLTSTFVLSLMLIGSNAIAMLDDQDRALIETVKRGQATGASLDEMQAGRDADGMLNYKAYQKMQREDAAPYINAIHAAMGPSASEEAKALAESMQALSNSSLGGTQQFKTIAALLLTDDEKEKQEAMAALKALQEQVAETEAGGLSSAISTLFSYFRWGTSEQPKEEETVVDSAPATAPSTDDIETPANVTEAPSSFSYFNPFTWWGTSTEEAPESEAAPQSTPATEPKEEKADEGKIEG